MHRVERTRLGLALRGGQLPGPKLIGTKAGSGWLLEELDGEPSPIPPSTRETAGQRQPGRAAAPAPGGRTGCSV